MDDKVQPAVAEKVQPVAFDAAHLEAFRAKLPFEVVATKLPGAFAGKALPAGFDLNTATPAALRAHGIFWNRPPPDADPRLVAAWKEAADRIRNVKEWLVPELEVQVGKRHVLGPVTRQSDGTYTGKVWSGGVLPGKWTGVIGQWNVPTVSKPPEPAGAGGIWTSSSWVGLDGAYGSNDVLQAGVQQQVDAHGNASYVAWYEWFAPQQPSSPGYIWQTNITNFPVKAGDMLFCSAQYVGTTAGHLYFANLTTNSPPLSITLAPPPGATFSGNSAEWIMECNDGGEPANSLPAFTPVDFSGGVACSATGPSANPQTGDNFIIQNGASKNLTQTTLGNGTVVIKFIG